MADPDNRPAVATSDPTGDLYDFLKTEMAHRRTRRQAVFAWVSSLLVGITGGTVALTYTKGVALSISQKRILTLVIAILFIFSCIWISHHWRWEIAARKNLASYFDHIAAQKTSYWPSRWFPGKVQQTSDNPHIEDWTTLCAIGLLTLATLIAVWWKP